MSDPTPYRRLTRTPDRVIAGVCGGAAAYLGIDPTVVRVLTVVAGFFTFPLVPLLYVVCWAVMPDARG